MLRKVKLYGDLAKFVGERVLEADVANAAQAVRFLVVNWPELEKYMADKHYKVVADKWELTGEELHYPTGMSDIKIVPVVGGAGGNTTRILIGAVLIGAAIAFAPAGASLAGIGGLGGGVGGTTFAIGTGAANFMIGVGSYLILGSIANMLTPVPELPESVDDPQRSFSFS